MVEDFVFSKAFPDKVDEFFVKAISQLLQGFDPVVIISLDPKRLGVLIMKTHNDMAIKATLNELFKRQRADKWNSYDTTIAISYLVQSEFRHIDLLAVLKKNAPELHRYYYNNCRVSFVRAFMTNGLINTNTLCRVIGKDWKSYYLYFMYYTEKAKNNNLTAYAFFKNFFDRITADLCSYCRIL